LIYKYNPEEFYLNELKEFSKNDYSKNVGILNFGLSFRYEFNKNPDE
jgi:predicted transcriptional regulator with HTH domain